MSKLSRRTFLRSTAATVALPILDANVAALPKSAQSSAIPKRLVFLPMGYGVVDTDWFPSKKQGALNLSPSLEPFEDVKSEISVLQNLTNKHSAGAHSATANLLTTANVKGKGGFKNTVSCDQLAAKVLGRDTRHSSLAIGGPQRSNDGHGGRFGYASWNEEGQPVGVYRNLTAVYKLLFGANNASNEKIRAQLARKQSSLDALTYNAKRLNSKISKEDRERVDEYFTTIRSIETRLSKAVEWVEKPRPKAPFKLSKGKIDGKEEIKLILDMMHLALQTDSTRVITYMLPTDAIIRHLRSRYNPHSLSHQGPEGGKKHKTYLQRDLAFSDLVAGFVKKLHTTKEQDGRSLLDHSLVAYGTSLRKVHNQKNGPMLLAGRGGSGKIKQGQNYVFPSTKTPLANLWLSMIRHVGVKQERFGDSKGVLKEIGFS